MPVGGVTCVRDTRTIATIGAAHFVSHFFILVLPPLFAFVREDYGVSYTVLGLALVAFNAASAILQTPAGFLVDRIGARRLLAVALLLGSLAFAVAGLTDSFWLLVAMFAVAGVANAIYHPADYALLSQDVAGEHAAGAYAFHTFAGMLGSAVAPVTMLLMQSHWGWRGAFLGAAVPGVAVALMVLARLPAPLRQRAVAAPANNDAAPAGWRLLLSAPIMLNFATFTLLALGMSGLQNYSVVASGALYGTTPVTANTALTGYLGCTALGVIAGGLLAARIERHTAFTAGGLFAVAAGAGLIVSGDPGAVGLIVIMGAIGLVTGTIMPARDLLVRQVTPPGAAGAVFGFVTTGFNIAGMIAPLVFGLAMDTGHPALVYLLVAAFSLLAVAAVAAQQARAVS